MPRSSRNQDIYPMALRELRVRAVTDLTPGMRRVEFEGEQLSGHTLDGTRMPPLISTGFDDDIRIIFPDPATGERPYPAPLGDGRLSWTAEVNRLFRTYTVRAVNPRAGTLTVDFARHRLGLAEGWVADAVPGDPVWIVGPKNCGSLPVHRDWLLLAGDETALPAIARCLEELPAGFPVHAVIEVPTRADQCPLATAGDADIRFVVRDEGGDFVEEVASLSLPQGTGFAWAAGEAGRLKPLRRLLKERGVAHEDLDVTGYWRATDASLDEEGRVVGGGYEVPFRLHELTDLAPALAIRTGAALNLFSRIDAGSTDPGRLARALGLAPERLVRLLRYLAALGVVTLSGSGNDGKVEIGLTALGRELANPESHAAAGLVGSAALRDLAFLELEAALRGDAPVPLGSERRTWAEIIGPARLAQSENAQAQWTAPAVAVSDDLAARRVLVVGPGAEVYAAEIRRRHPDSAVRVGSLDGRVAGADAPDLSGEIVGTHGEQIDALAAQPADDPTAETAVAIDPFAWAPAAEIPGLLTGLGVPEVHVVTSFVPLTGGEEHDYENDLLRMCLTDTAIPSVRQLSRALAEAGFVVTRERAVGWGTHVVSVERCEESPSKRRPGRGLR